MAEAVVRLRVDASGATRALNGVQNQTNKLQSSFNGLRNAILASGVVLVGRQAVKTSANFEKLNVRLGLLTKSSADFAKSQQIAADAQKAFGLSAVEALEGVTDITARLAPLGTSVEDIRTVFFGFNTAAKLAGASAIESSNAFRQLAQALGSGRLAGDEFRSVSEQVPTVLAPIAAELGVTIGELKKLAAEGELSSEVVLRALGKVGNEGSGFLKELLKNDPTQVFKNFSNATEDLSRAFGDKLRPVVEDVTKLLTQLIIKTTELVNSPIGQTAASNCLFEHESGFNDNTSSMDGVFIESADVDIGDGDAFAFVKKVIPDIAFVNDVGTSQNGAVNFVLKRRNFPNETLSTDSTLQITASTTYQSLRSRARQVVVRIESDDDNDLSNRLNYKWKLGSTRMDIQPSGRR